MKKFLCLLLASMLMVTTVGCGGGSSAFDKDAILAEADALAEDLVAGDYDAAFARFDENMKSSVPKDVLQSTWEQTVAPLGAYIGPVSVESFEDGDSFTVEKLIKYEGSGIKLTISYTPELLINGLYIGFGYADDAEVTDEFTEKEVVVDAGAEMPLGGLLTVPNGVENPPVVLLIQGSGSSDRNENIYGNKPFKDIAQGLAKAGIASLRYDKRHYIYPADAMRLGTNLTMRDEYLDDVAAALALLKDCEDVDSSRIYVLGHSLGGMMAPAIASEHSDLAGIISMAGTLRPLWEIVYDQNMEAIALQQMLSSIPQEQQEALAAQRDQIEAQVDVLRTALDSQTDDTILLGISCGYWKTCKEYCGANFVEGLTIPMLILQGTADFQVSMKDYNSWVEAVGSRENVTCKLYDGLNHLMMPTNGLRNISEYMTTGHVSQAVIDDIAAFIQQ